MPVWTTNLTSPGRVHSNKLRRSFSTACKYFHRSTQRHISEVSSRSGHADNASRLSQPPSFTPSGHGTALPPEPGLGNSWKGTFSLLASGFHKEVGSSWPHFCQMLFLMDFSSVLSRKCLVLKAKILTIVLLLFFCPLWDGDSFKENCQPFFWGSMYQHTVLAGDRPLESNNLEDRRVSREVVLFFPLSPSTAFWT